MFNEVPPAEALERLLQGNRAYAEDRAGEERLAHSVLRRHLVEQQRPFGIVLGCSDSRVPVEIVFNQNLGDLFVIRVAGNVLNDHVIGSIEYAVEMFGSSLLMVMGHSQCGAVRATVDSILHGTPVNSRANALIDSIRPAIESVPRDRSMLEAAIEANIRHVARALEQSTPIIAPAVAAGRLGVVGAEYHLETGLVSVITQAVPKQTERSPAHAAE
ncbi:MAG: carbonic anhydrase [Candidatus Baltobacteraceae bacterium]